MGPPGTRDEDWFSTLYAIQYPYILKYGRRRLDDPDGFRDPGTPGPDTGLEMADVRAALATLSGIDQEILRLIGWEELTVAEAAGVLGCSRATAAVRLHRARRRLTDAMAARAVPPVPRPSRVRS